MRKHLTKTTPKYFSGHAGEMGEFEIKFEKKHESGADFVEKIMIFFAFWAKPSGCWAVLST